MTDLELPITEPQLLERLAMDDRQFGEYVRGLAGSLPAREYEEGALARALGYPWERPAGSYRLSDAGVEPARGDEPGRARRGDRRAQRRRRASACPCSRSAPTAPPRCCGASSPTSPRQRDRAVLALTGRLHEFDVGFAAQPALYGSMPGDPLPQPRHRGLARPSSGSPRRSSRSSPGRSSATASAGSRPASRSTRAAPSSTRCSSSSPASAPFASRASRSPWRRCRPTAARRGR